MNGSISVSRALPECLYSDTAAALRPAEVDKRAGTVAFGATHSRSDSGRYEVGTTKTVESQRTIRVPQRVLDTLDLTHEYVLATTTGTPVQGDSCRIRSVSDRLPAVAS
jgi:hypothetical protein